MVLMEERQRREREIELQSKFMQEQMEMLIKMVADQLSIKLPERGAEMVEQDMEFTKLTETDICRGQERNVPHTYRRRARNHLQRSSMDTARSWITHYSKETRAGNQ